MDSKQQQTKVLDIHPEAEARLHEVLVGSLGQIVVENNMFLDHGSTESLKDLDKVLSHGTETWKTLNSILGERPISEFIEDQIVRRLESLYEYDSEAGPVPLLSLDRLGDDVSLANQLVTDLKTLPYSYTFFVRLPEALAEPSLSALGSKTVNLTGNLSLVPTTPSLNDQFPNPGSFINFKGLLGLPPDSPFYVEKQWPEDAYFLKYQTKGYLLRSDRGPFFEEVLHMYRATMGFALAYSLVSTSYQHFSRQPEVKLSVFRHDGSNVKYQETRAFPFDFSTCFLGLTISDWILDAKGSKSDKYIRMGWDFVRLALTLAEKDERLLRAAQWFFDSHSSQSELLGFVQAAVVLEILLGDKATSDLIGLGELLRNRCAYLIGRNEDDRREIMEDFNRIYTTRSKIVHSGKNHLSRTEMEDLYRLRSLCSRVIEKEVEMRSSKQSEVT